MNNTLTYFGTDPQMLGLATVGGLLSLMVLLYQLARFLYRKRTLISGSLYVRRRRKLLRDIREYKISVKRKKQKKSDLFIIREELRDASMGLYWFLIDSVLFAINVFFYFSDRQANLFNKHVATFIIILAIVDAFKIRRNVLRAWQVIDWAYFPERGASDLTQRAKRIRERK